MVQRIGGERRKTRGKYRKAPRTRGKLSITSYLKTYKPGDRVVLKAETSYQKGIYYRRFHGLSGIVQKQRGFCYEVAIKDKNKSKTVIVHPIHIKKV